MNDIHSAIHRAAYAQREPDHGSAPVADGRDAMKCALDTGAVIRVKLAHAFIHVVQFGARYFGLAQFKLAIHKTDGGDAPQIQNDLEQVLAIVCFFHRMADVKREDIEESIEVVSYFKLGHGYQLIVNSKYELGNVKGIFPWILTPRYPCLRDLRKFR